MAKPFVKWAGGKGKLLDTIDRKLPTDFKSEPITFVDPFVGGGAVLFYILENYSNINRIIVNDINPALINCYRIIKENPDDLIIKLQKIAKKYYKCVSRQEQKEFYYYIRSCYNAQNLDRISLDAAAYFMFLNRTCFNGLYRENIKGQFNVPIGSYVHPTICNEMNIRAVHQALNKVEILCGDFMNVLNSIQWQENTFFYLDPPYRPLSKSANFKNYTKQEFGDKQQEYLKIMCDIIDAHGGKFLLSNSDSEIEPGTNYFQHLYIDYIFEKIFAPRYINAYVSQRENASEVLIRNYEI